MLGIKQKDGQKHFEKAAKMCIFWDSFEFKKKKRNVNQCTNFSLFGAGNLLGLDLLVFWPCGQLMAAVRSEL